MDTDRLMHVVARFTDVAEKAGAQPTFPVPFPVLCEVTEDKSEHLSRAMTEVLTRRSVGYGDLVELHESGEGGPVLRRWAADQLRRLSNRTPTGVTGEPMSWEEATAIEPPLLVAVKSMTEPSYAHLRSAARQHMAASPLRAVLRPEDPAPGESVRQKAPGSQTGALVALIPSEEAKQTLASLGTENPDELHVTLHYPGQVADLDATGYEKLLPRIRALAALHAPVEARVAGQATFNPTGDEPAHVLILNHPGISKVHRDATDIVESTLSGNLTKQHAPYIPHITLGYGGPQPKVPDDVFDNPLVLDRVRLGWGETDHDIPLTGTQ